MVAADLTLAEQVALDQATEAFRLPNAGEPAYDAASGVRGQAPDPPASQSTIAPPTEASLAVARTRRAVPSSLVSDLSCLISPQSPGDNVLEPTTVPDRNEISIFVILMLSVL